MTTRAPNIAVRPFFALMVAALVALLAVACGGGGGSASPTAGRPAAVSVVTTLPVFADFVRQAGGDRVEVLAVLPRGIDPDAGELPPADVERIARAGLVLYNGLDLETTAEDQLFQHKRRDAQIVAYANDVDSPTSPGKSAAQARDNPYLWLDPVLALTYVDTTWDSLVIVDGGAANTYQENADRYKEQLRSLHQEITQKMESIPPEKRKLVTFDDSFFHMARRYGLEMVRLPTPVSTDAPGPRRVQEWADLLRGQGVPAVFTEPGFSSVLLNQAAGRAGVKVCTLYSGSLDDQVTTYIEMMTFNADELVRCLGGG